MKLHVRRAHGSHRRVADLRILSHIDQVAGGSEFAAASQAIAVHLGNDRLAQVPDAERAFDDMTGPLAGAIRRVLGLILIVAAAKLISR